MTATACEVSARKSIRPKRCAQFAAFILGANVFAQL
jgi:hypothetical protein